MRAIAWLIAVAVLLAGCTQVDENPKFNAPSELPPWAYDAPVYYQPPQDLAQLETIGNGIGVYYTPERSFFVRHPGGYQLSGMPRVAVFYSTDRGGTWMRAGYFGVEQTHFSFLAKEEGDYWVRFVGPGQGIVDCPPGTPHRVYIADRRGPAIVMSVAPPPWMDKKHEEPRIYEVGQNVRVDWGVSDPHLDPNTLRMSICFADFPHNVIWSVLPETLTESGSMTVELPAEAARYGGVRLRVEARDKAGNIGLGLTDVLHVQGGDAGTPSPTTRPTATLKAATQPAKPPAGPFERTTGPDDRPGWPAVYQRILKGSPQRLEWLPQAAANYGTVELQFSADDGLTWRTVATGLKVGQPVKWTAPDVRSATCRLRIAAIVQLAKDGGERNVVTLAMTQQFAVVDTLTTAPGK